MRKGLLQWSPKSVPVTISLVIKGKRDALRSNRNEVIEQFLYHNPAALGILENKSKSYKRRSELVTRKKTLTFF